MIEEEHELRYTIYITSYGKKPKVVRDIGHTLSKFLDLTFRGRYRLMDHRSQPVNYNPDEHDWGLGDNWPGPSLTPESSNT